MENAKIKVLIIDDDEVDRMMIKRALKLSGFNADVFTATDIETGTSLAHEDNFNCIFLDYNLPGNNGFGFLEEYKANGGLAPVIIVTSKGDEKLAVEAIKKGAIDYIPKNMITAECVSQILRSTFNTNAILSNTTNQEKPNIEIENRLEAVIANTPLILFSIDQNGIFNLFKGRGIENLQVSPEQVLGKSVFEIENILPIKAMDYKNALFGNKFSSIGELLDHFYEVHFMPVMEDNQNAIGMNGIMMDITSIKKNEQKLQDLLAATEKNIIAKDVLVNNLQNKLSDSIEQISNHAQTLLETNLSEEQSLMVGEIKYTIGDVTNIIDHLFVTNENGHENSSIKLPENIIDNSSFSNSNHVKCTNLNYLRQLADNNDSFVKDFITIFLETAPASLIELDEAVKNKNWQAIKQTAHKIKPSLSYLGMKEIHEAASEVEKHAKDQVNFEMIEALIAKITSTCHKAFKELEQEIKDLSLN